VQNNLSSPETSLVQVSHGSDGRRKGLTEVNIQLEVSTVPDLSKMEIRAEAMQALAAV